MPFVPVLDQDVLAIRPHHRAPIDGVGRVDADEVVDSWSNVDVGHDVATSLAGGEMPPPPDEHRDPYGVLVGVALLRQLVLEPLESVVRQEKDDRVALFQGAERSEDLL